MIEGWVLNSNFVAVECCI